MIDAAVLGAYLAGLCAVSAWTWRRRSGVADYVVASRGLTLPAFVATLVPSFYGGVLGIGEFTWSNGLSNWLVMGLPYYVFSAVYAVWLAGKVRVSPGLTIPDHFELAYGRAAALQAAVLVFALSSPADEVVMIGVLWSHFSGWALPSSMAAGAGLGLLIVLGGGLRSDAAANALQFAVLLCGFALALPLAAARLGGAARLAAALPASHLSLTGHLTAWRIVSWWLIAVWTIVDPAFHQRCAAAQDAPTARRGLLVCIAFWAAIDAMTTTAGLMARAAFPRLDHPLLAYPQLADTALPPGARGLFLAGIASSILAGLQARALQSSISLGKDLAGRLGRLSEAATSAAMRAALGAALVLGFGLALLLPSVVGLWYAIGSAIIPGLLWPLIGVYYPGLRAPPRAALAASACGWAISTSWLAASQRLGRAPWGVEPMFPGLAISAAIWAAGLAWRKRLA